MCVDTYVYVYICMCLGEGWKGMHDCKCEWSK